MRIIWILVTFSAFIAAATAITCYDCNSISDPRCNQYFRAEGTKETDCDDADMPRYLQPFMDILRTRIPARGCITKVFIGSKVGDNPLYIRRGCFYGFVDDTEAACEEKDPYVPWATLLDCHVCNDDLCNVNSGRKSALNIIVFSVTLLFSFFVNKIL